MSFFDMRRFRSTGNLWPKSESQKVSDWAPDAIVCGCLKVNRGALSLAISQGCSTVQELSRRTGASSMCGSCRPLLEDLLGVDEDKSKLPINLLNVGMGPVSVRERGPNSRRDTAPRSRRSVPPPAITRTDLGPLSSRVGGARSSVMMFNEPALQSDDSEAGPVSVRRPSLLPGRVAAVTDPDAAPRSVRSSFLPGMLMATGVEQEPAASHRGAVDVLQELDMPPPSEDMASGAVARAPVTIVGPEGVVAENNIAPAMRDSNPGERSSSIPPDRESSPGDAAPMSRRSWVPPKRASLPPPPPKPMARPTAVLIERGLTALFVASTFSVALAGVMLMWPTKIAETTADVWAWRIERMLNDNMFRQVSGYVLLGLCVLTLLLSLRKRWKRFTFSDLPIFRMIHGLIGMLTVAALILHTGLRMGSHMMLVLSIDFLAVALMGAMAGAITALSAGWPPVTMRDHRLRWYRVHLMVCWPLPILILLHILQVYYY